MREIFMLSIVRGTERDQILRAAYQDRGVLLRSLGRRALRNPVMRRCSDYIAEISFVKSARNESRNEVYFPLTLNVLVTNARKSTFANSTFCF